MFCVYFRTFLQTLKDIETDSGILQETTSRDLPSWVLDDKQTEQLVGICYVQHFNQCSKAIYSLCIIFYCFYLTSIKKRKRKRSSPLQKLGFLGQSYPVQEHNLKCQNMSRSRLGSKNGE